MEVAQEGDRRSVVVDVQLTRDRGAVRRRGRRATSTACSRCGGRTESRPRVAQRPQGARARAAASRLDDRAARRRRLARRDRGDVLRERAREGARSAARRRRGALDDRRGLGHRGRRRSTAAPGSTRRATPRRARPRSRSCSASSTASATGARATSRSSSRSRPTAREVRGTGVLEGRIADAPSGAEGFGYDPVFVPDGEERTVAELGDGWKARALAPRARCARATRGCRADRRRSGDARARRSTS